ncbi:MAG: 1-acyl-sn-glycerol-3-phosphate acyltransferase [Clostridia bacterium]|nr:1-acyl-sn-glycerol-3-phosphate acyltransferase [Clostridia bacterium]
MKDFKKKAFSWKVIIKVVGHLLFVMGPKIKYFNHLEKKGAHEKRDAFAFKAVRKWSKFVVRAAKLNIEVEGIEKIPTDRPVLFTPNHQSYADIPVLLYALSDFYFGFMMKISLAGVPFIGAISKMLKSVPVNQENPREAVKAVHKTIETIESGHSMLIFPEGKRGYSNTPDEFKNGAFKIVQKTNVTVVPIYIRNVFKVLEGNDGVVAPADIKITILDPIETDNMTRADVKDLHDKVYNVILDESKKYED